MVKAWRRSRPFWGGLFIVAAGLELLSVSFTMDALPVTVMSGTVGAGYLIALVLVIAGVLVWWQPGQRVFLGLVAVLLSLASFVYSDLGGFLLGMLLGLLGGVLVMAWTPLSRPAGRVDTITVRDVLAAARACTARIGVPRRAVALAVGRRLRRLLPVRRAGVEIDPAPADTRRVAKLREPAG